MDVFIRDRGSNSTPPISSYPYILLTRDNWNDFSYYTFFRAGLVLGLDDALDLGWLRIMREGQLEGIANRPFNDIPFPNRIPQELIETVCSLAPVPDYYDKLFAVAHDVALDVLLTLRDAAFLPEVRERFQSEECFKVSLLRESAARELLDGAGARFGTIRKFKSRFSVGIKLEGASRSHEFDFNFEPRGGAPRRMHAIVGLNGVGKTQVMARLAMLLSRFSKKASQENRSTLQSDDTIDPVPSIYTVVAVSFSAFDEFEKPTHSQGEKFRYSYCGLQKESGGLKSKDDLLEEIRTMIAADMPADKKLLLKSVLRNLVRVEDLDSFVDEPALHATLYERLSAGQRLALSCICHILAKVGPRTLILFDEPELHLHPQLLTGLLASLSEILENQDSFAIVATHSPLVVQQLPKECVHVIRRDRMTPMVLRPTFQTFGESLSEITRLVFASMEADRDYRNVLTRMYNDAEGDVEKVRQLFDGQLSLNADIYLESLRADVEKVQ